MTKEQSEYLDRILRTCQEDAKTLQQRNKRERAARIRLLRKLELRNYRYPSHEQVRS